MEPSLNQNAAARRIQRAWLARRKRVNSAAKRIQGTWLARKLYGKRINNKVIRLPRNYTNNVLYVPLTSPVVVQFRNGKKTYYTNVRTLNSMRQRNGTYISPLSRQPVTFKVRRVKYYGSGNNNKKNDNLANRIKKAANNQNRMRKGKALLGSIVHMNQTNQNAQVARNLQARFLAEANENNRRVRNNSRQIREARRRQLEEVRRAERQAREAVQLEEQRRQIEERQRRNEERRRVIAERLAEYVAGNYGYTPHTLTRQHVGRIAAYVNGNVNIRGFPGLPIEAVQYIRRAHRDNHPIGQILPRVNAIVRNLPNIERRLLTANSTSAYANAFRNYRRLTE